MITCFCICLFEIKSIESEHKPTSPTFLITSPHLLLLGQPLLKNEEYAMQKKWARDQKMCDKDGIGPDMTQIIT
jgi:hypothetical protein